MYIRPLCKIVIYSRVVKHNLMRVSINPVHFWQPGIRVFIPQPVKFS